MGNYWATARDAGARSDLDTGSDEPTPSPESTTPETEGSEEPEEEEAAPGRLRRVSEL